MIPTLSARASEREQLDADVAAFLARGGKIKQAEIRQDVVPWRGNDAMGIRSLRTAGYCAASFRMSKEKFEVMAKEPGFPQCYLWRGEYYWVYSQARDYWRNKRKGQV